MRQQLRRAASSNRAEVRGHREQQTKRLARERLTRLLRGDLFEPRGDRVETASANRPFRALPKRRLVRRRVHERAAAGHRLELVREGAQRLERVRGDGTRGVRLLLLLIHRGDATERAKHALHLLLTLRRLLRVACELFETLPRLLLETFARALARGVVVLGAFRVRVRARATSTFFRLFPSSDSAVVVVLVARPLGFVRVVVRVPREFVEGHELEHLVEGVAAVAVHDVKRVARRAPTREHRAADGVGVFLARVFSGEKDATLGAAEFVVIIRGRAHGDVRVRPARARIRAPAAARHGDGIGRGFPSFRVGGGDATKRAHRRLDQCLLPSDSAASAAAPATSATSTGFPVTAVRFQNMNMRPRPPTGSSGVPATSSRAVPK